MITYKTGDIINEPVEAVVNPVNCVGVMGRGLALEFKNNFPDMYNNYMIACNRREVVPGKMHVYKTDMLSYPSYIINFPTKRHWRDPSFFRDIELGLVDLVMTVKQFNIESIAIPALGCGLGGLSWNVVQSAIEDTFKCTQDVNVIVFKPQ